MHNIYIYNSMRLMIIYDIKYDKVNLITIMLSIQVDDETQSCARSEWNYKLDCLRLRITLCCSA